MSRKKVESEHNVNCAVNAAEVCDEFAAMGCTCGADATQRKHEMDVAAEDLRWHEQHRGVSGHSPDWEEGFLAGIRHAANLRGGF